MKKFAEFVCATKDSQKSSNGNNQNDRNRQSQKRFTETTIADTEDNTQYKQGNSLIVRSSRRKNALRHWRSFDTSLEERYCKDDKFELPPLTWDLEDETFEKDLFYYDPRAYFAQRMERCRRSGQWREVINSYRYLCRSWVVGERDYHQNMKSEDLVVLHCIIPALILDGEWQEIWDILEAIIDRYGAEISPAIVFIMHEAIAYLRADTKPHNKYANEFNTKMILEELYNVKEKSEGPSDSEEDFIDHEQYILVNVHDTTSQL